MISAYSPTFPSLHLRHRSFSNPSVALPTLQLILQTSVASPTSQLILQPFRCFTYVTAHSPTFLSPFLRHRIFTLLIQNTTFTTTASISVLRTKVLEEVGVQLLLCDFKHLLRGSLRKFLDTQQLSTIIEILPLHFIKVFFLSIY